MFLLAFTALLPTISAGEPDEARLVIIELRIREHLSTASEIPLIDDSMHNPDYLLLPFHWKSTIDYYINPSNKQGLSTTGIVNTITISAETWDGETRFEVFSYIGTTSRTALKRDRLNIIDFGRTSRGTIAVTYIWYIGDSIVETDMRLNTYYAWSLTGEATKMDVQDIATHEFGHWCGLDDLYDEKDYWLTMYGYGDYGQTYARSLGKGDILGLEAVYGN